MSKGACRGCTVIAVCVQRLQQRHRYGHYRTTEVRITSFRSENRVKFDTENCTGKRNFVLSSVSLFIVSLSASALSPGSLHSPGYLVTDVFLTEKINGIFRTKSIRTYTLRTALHVTS